MKYRQSNANLVPDDLNTRDREHYEVARGMPGWFSSGAFRQRYGTEYPTRNVSSIIPTDYCVNRENKGNKGFPRFLEWDGGSRYRFVGLDRGLRPTFTATAEQPAPTCAESLTARSSKRVRSLQTASRFLPVAGRGLVLREETVCTAILAYNKDPRVRAQERMASEALGAGFSPGRVEGQLRALDRAYSTRSKASDLAVIAQHIEEHFGQWRQLLSLATPLEKCVTPENVITDLMNFFLGLPTVRKPRSLATKALHFAAPKCFAPVDTYAADLVGGLLGAGKWSDTQSLDAKGMAVWYHDYLGVLKAIGAANPSLFQRLMVLDAESAQGLDQDRVRGLPKIVDKVLWWLGQPGKDGRSAPLFE